MHTRFAHAIFVALTFVAELGAQDLPPPSAGGVVDIEATSGSEVRTQQHDYLPAKPYVILTERIERSVWPLFVQEFSDAASGAQTSTFSLDLNYAANHPEIIRPVRGVGISYLGSGSRYSDIILKTVWDNTGKPAFELKAVSEDSIKSYAILGAGEGQIFGSGSGPASVPRPMFHADDISETEGKVSWFSWTPGFEYRHLPGIQYYWTETQPDGSSVVYHTNFYDPVPPGLGQFKPLGVVTTTGEAGHGSKATLVKQPFEAADAYEKLKQADWTFMQTYQPVMEAEAHYAFGADAASASKLRYKLQIQPGLPRTITWMETFTPEGASEPSNRRFFSETVTAEATETPTYIINPFERLGYQPGRYRVVAFESDAFDATLTADTNGDGALLPASGPMTEHVIANADAVSAIQPYQIQANLDDDDSDGTPDAFDDHVNGAADLADFFPVFLNIKSLLTNLPSGVVCKISQADGALNFVYTDLKQSNAFSFRNDSRAEGYGPDFAQSAAEATVLPITKDGVPLSADFLDRICNNSQGVILIEARLSSSASLVLTIETGTGVVLISLPLQASGFGLYADSNRDGEIKIDGSDTATTEQPYRFWINDDDDDGDISDTGPSLLNNPDEPGYLSGFWELDGRTPDHENPGVDGRSDLLDFFPVCLDVSQLLVLWPHTTAGITYKLKQEDSALNFTYTNLNRAEAFDFLKYSKEQVAYGLPNSPVRAHEALPVQITASGVVIDAGFLAHISNDTDKGVILIEGKKATDKPLELIVEQDGIEVAKRSLNIRISEVEKMYRWANLRGVTGQSMGRQTDLSVPTGYPDSVTNGKMFIFVHGYNVNERQSRAWNAEAFKRLYQSGSRAMFTAVSWNGDYGQIPFIGVSPDYWENITRAFRTAQVLASLATDLPGLSKVIAGHSMGNVVVSSAIKDHALSVAKYIMLNAAVALEAYDTSATDVNAMRPEEWQEYERRLWSTDWHTRFSDGDGRRGLAWADRFGNLPNAVNIYSSGENVLNNNDETPGKIPEVGTERIWIIQEMAKGTTHLAALLTFDIQGGWGYNTKWLIAETTTAGGPHGSTTTTTFRRRTPDEAAMLTDDQLLAEPFFLPFNNDDFTNPVGGSAAASDLIARADALGGAIPALSFPAGRNPVFLFGATRNRDLMTLQDGWPQGRFSTDMGWVQEGNAKKGRWWHSDIKNIAYLFNYPAWDIIVNEGKLK